MPYIGNQPGTGVRNRFIYTATASQTTFSGADNNGKTLKYADSDFVDVFLNGVCLVPAVDYTSTTKTSVVLTQAASLNDTLEVIAYDIASIADTVSKADGGTFEANVTFAAGADIITATAGTDNVRLGENAGDSIASGGNNNVVIGKDAGTAITTGDANVAVGFEALATEDANGQNVAVGYRALKTLNAGTEAQNTAVGYNAGTSITTGVENVLVGATAGDAITDADFNVGIGWGALGANVLGSKSVAVGTGVLDAQNPASATDMHNTAVGHGAGGAVTTGTLNTAIGSLALDAATVNNRCTAIGYAALSAHNNTSTATSDNTAVGANAGVAVTTGTINTIVGANAGSTMDTGYDNTFVGASAGASLTSGYSNTFVGKTSGQLTTGNNNTYIGRYDGNQDGIDIRTASNYIVLSDGAGNVRQVYWGGDGRMYMRQTLSPWADGSYNLGTASNKWAALFATNGTIQTSDENEKQQIASLTSAEITAATAISKLFKTYKMNSSVEDKGDAARIHSGVIAQQVKAAMNDAGLDETKYGFWCSDTWWTKDREVEAIEANEELGIEAKDAYTFTDRWEKEEDVPEGATKHTVLGIRYDELLAFVCAGTEQRLTSIEARLTALEAG